MKPLPDKIEARLAELIAMKEFNEYEAEYCRRTYWNIFSDGSLQRKEWHSLLVTSYDRAKARLA